MSAWRRQVNQLFFYSQISLNVFTNRNFLLFTDRRSRRKMMRLSSKKNPTYFLLILSSSSSPPVSLRHHPHYCHHGDGEKGTRIMWVTKQRSDMEREETQMFQCLDLLQSLAASPALSSGDFKPTSISSSTLEPGFCGCPHPNCQSAILFPPPYSLYHSKEYFHFGFLWCYGPFSGAMQMWTKRVPSCSEEAFVLFDVNVVFLSTAQTEAQRVQWNTLFTWVYAVKHVGMKNSCFRWIFCVLVTMMHRLVLA